jgi:aspartate/methionine/tyrosine aminotransferase
MFSRRTAWSLAPNALARALEAHRRANRELLDLTASNPTEVGLRYEEAAILKGLGDSAALRYRPEPKGLIAARRAVAEYYRELSSAPSDRGPQPARFWRNGVEVRVPDTESIVLTVSTSEAYSFVFRLLCDVDDEILMPTPSYPLFEFLAGLQDVRLVPYSLLYDQGWHIDFHSLESALTAQSRAIILVHPNNPTGSYVKPGERDLLNGFCAAHGMALVVDEVFLDYCVGESPGCTAAGAKAGFGAIPAQNLSFAFNRDTLTFTLSGISKISGLPQMKLAWIVVSGPEELVHSALSRLEIIADTYLSLNGPIQHAAPVLLAQRHGVRQQLLARMKTNLAELDRQLAGQPLCCRLVVEGGWYVILRVPVTRTDEQLAIRLLEERNVLVQPGYFYDFRNDGHLVLSLITPEEEFQEGVRRVLESVLSDS